MKKMIENLNATMEYYKGCPKGTFREVLDEMKNTKVNGWNTSSIPLAESWQPAYLKRWEKILAPHLKGVNLERAFKYLEFPTEPVLRGKVYGQPSMTDLMIMDALDWKVAVEGKFTEYVWGKAQTCADWLKERMKTRPRLLPYRFLLRAWVEMIASAKCTDISMPELYKTCMGIDYQFLHRTASACWNTNGSEEQKPVLMYQLFYKAGDAAHIAKMEAFKDDLRRAARLLRLKNMTFLIVSVPITNADKVEARYGHLVKQENAQLFEDMKLETIYEFDFDHVEVEEVIKGGK